MAIVMLNDPLLAYPVGSIYMSVSDISPDSIFGGTWERIQTGRFLIAAGGGENSTPTTDGASDAANAGNTNWYGVGAKGGERSHLLTAAESGLRAHTHGLTAPKVPTMGDVASNLEGYNPPNMGNVMRRVPAGETATANITTTGGAVGAVTGGAVNATTAHENRPPYLAVYMWKRVA